MFQLSCKRRGYTLLIKVIAVGAAILWLASSCPRDHINNAYKHIERSTIYAKLNPIGNDSLEDTCSQKTRNVFFLKVHKAASSTTQNIFLRYAITNGLNVALPNHLIGSFHIIGSKVFRDNLIPNPVNETYQILCNHLIYNNSMIRDIMPQGTFYAGIVRDPIKQFASGLRYFGFMKKIQEKLHSMNLNMSNEEAILYYGRERKTFQNMALYLNNLQSLDFGLKREDFEKNDTISKFIDNIDKEFDLILIPEYYDESLVLLKRYLCWDLKDILYVDKLVGSDQKKEEVNFMDNPKIISWLNVWNKADFALYKHFQTKFWSLVHEQGKLFFLEVQYFVFVRERIIKFCKNIIPEIEYISINESRWNEKFYVDRHDCEIMQDNEIHLVKKMMIEAASKVNYTLTTKSPVV